MISFGISKVMPLWSFTSKPMPCFVIRDFLCLIFFSSDGRSRWGKPNFNDHATWCAPAPSRILETSMSTCIVRYPCHVAGACASRRIPSHWQKTNPRKKALRRNDYHHVKWRFFSKSYQSMYPKWPVLLERPCFFFLTSKWGHWFPVKFCCFGPCNRAFFSKNIEEQSMPHDAEQTSSPGGEFHWGQC